MTLTLPPQPVAARPRDGALRIAFLLRDAHVWGSTVAAPMLGGREYACVRVAEELAARGQHVVIFAAGAQGSSQRRNGVVYAHHADVIAHAGMLDPFDVVIAVQGYDLLARLRNPVLLAWVQTGMATFRHGLDARITRYIVNSPAKRGLFAEANPRVDPAKVVVLPNGTDTRPYDHAYAATVPRRLLWTQSPDRGLAHLLRWWPTLRERFPDLTLHVTYRALEPGDGRWSHHLAAAWLHELDDGLAQPGVTVLGVVSRDQLVRAQKACALYVYPCDPHNRGETGSIGILEMAAARVPMLLSDDIALAEYLGAAAWVLPLPIDDATWINGITDLLRDPHKRIQWVHAARKVAEAQSWEKISAGWLDLCRAAVPR